MFESNDRVENQNLSGRRTALTFKRARLTIYRIGGVPEVVHDCMAWTIEIIQGSALDPAHG